MFNITIAWSYRFLLYQINQSHVAQWLNGSKVLDFEIGSQVINELILRSKFKNHPHYHADKEGYIMLQHHGQRGLLSEYKGEAVIAK
ncbi:MAG: hypothetical protein ABIR66_07915 [Saprospiraceae bacterium]